SAAPMPAEAPVIRTTRPANPPTRASALAARGLLAEDPAQELARPEPRGRGAQQDPILLLDPQTPERRAAPAHGPLQLAVRDPLVLVEDRHAIPVPGLDVAVDQLLRRVQSRRVAGVLGQAVDPLGPERPGRKEARRDRAHRHLCVAVLGAGHPGPD